MKKITVVFSLMLVVLASLSMFSCKKYHSIYAADWKLVSFNDKAVEGNGVLTMDEDDNFVWNWNGEISAKGFYKTDYDTIWFYNDSEYGSTERMEIIMVNNNDLILKGVYSVINTTDTINLAFARMGSLAE